MGKSRRAAVKRTGASSSSRPLSLRARLLLWWVRTEYAIARKVLPDVYANDGLISFHRHAFLDDPAFQRAYERGARALGGQDWYQWHWRVHVGLWAAASASKLDGDFVECGVNYGFLSSAVMEYLDWDRLGKTFYLLDTFAGLDPRFSVAGDSNAGDLQRSEHHLRTGMYVSGVDSVRANFAQWQNQRIIVGSIPETLDQVDARAVAFLHIDMNCAPPEVAALRFFWPRLSPGAFVLLDDYAYRGFDEQRLAMDELARELDVPICALPTGQGLLIKPARESTADRAPITRAYQGSS
ncbi:TylF/MycF family methyltransferase [Mycobacterium sp. SMC-2]|uniref:TylF/MycF family methyltransferase n=1 Tax=Mycobacterium sp. SMC-2 TaxID=2857058 RepID=UPI0021B3B3CF|nr:TylF/MycF family methyltransferase [Mycobacterium sp. SMC-2]UXA04211.1 TylF/MycF family methyltransferase [Mycobacterium sp. SMC-2]